MTRGELTGIIAVSCLLTAGGMWRAAATSSAAAVPEAVSHPAEPARPPRRAEAAPPPTLAVVSLPAPPSPEASLMVRLRQAKDPDLVAELAREGNHRFPDSEGAPERASLLIHALAAQGLASEARGEAEDMVNRYPDSEWVREIERFTGAHRRRNLRLSETGAVESY